MVHSGDVTPGNAFFATTQELLGNRGGHGIDCTIEEAFDIDSLHLFKGNVDLDKLREVFQEYPHERIPFCMVTITSNNMGGQPVSMENIREVRKLCDQYKVPILLDAARFAENAYFIKSREDGYADKTIKEIVLEMFSYADGMTMSGKKDGLANIGGFLACRTKQLFEAATKFNILFEGFPTYGGMTGRDKAAMAQGMDEVTEYAYLHARVEQVRELGRRCIEAGVPIQKPVGGHAVYIDALKFLPDVPQSQFPAQTLGIELYKEAGIRALAIGNFATKADPKEKHKKNDFLRLAIPRRTYFLEHINYVAEAVIRLFERRHEITTGYELKEDVPIVNYYTVSFKKDNTDLGKLSFKDATSHGNNGNELR
ncbi:unnamed protein product [Cyprideis torosa]|uniref:Uncharacterized protein n=1 Tax=Cyprideis torosa TaxID=163714 RepID=A0A7R8W331_9CRUS|nr:unnamed protein product [Cyprideis torosa]CAG0879278.1 unnamed protein product [Cyprideis torosa]